MLLQFTGSDSGSRVTGSFRPTDFVWRRLFLLSERTVFLLDLDVTESNIATESADINIISPSPEVLIESIIVFDSTEIPARGENNLSRHITKTRMRANTTVSTIKPRRSPEVIITY
ncbi:MAG: hypothetical protein K2J65_09400 [Duncaniella sp.]|nr:hypothetical protein [Duncaniella sp.]